MSDGGWPALPPPNQQPAEAVVTNDEPAIEKPKAQRNATGPKWETEARERVRSGIRRFSKPLADLVTRDANEGDTRLLVTDFLCEALGFDKYADLTTEYQVKGEFADYGIRIDKDLVAFIEVKRVATTLNPKHLRQVTTYSANEGVEWMILTNGVVWRAYHLGGTVPLEIDLALEVNLLGEDTAGQKAAMLFYLSRESLRRRQIDELWKARRATSPKSLASVLTSTPVVDAVRKQLRRVTGQNVDDRELERLLRETVIREECL